MEQRLFEIEKKLDYLISLIEKRQQQFQLLTLAQMAGLKIEKVESDKQNDYDSARV